MIVSTRGRYALRIMIDIAENGGGKYIPMKEVAAPASTTPMTRYHTISGIMTLTSKYRSSQVTSQEIPEITAISAIISRVRFVRMESLGEPTRFIASPPYSPHRAW